jgi:hypothetical protein
LSRAPPVENWRRLLHLRGVTSLRRQLLVWQIVSGLGISGLVLWAVLLPRTIDDKAALAQLVRAVPISFAVMVVGLVPNVALLVRHRELRNWDSVVFVLGIAMTSVVLALMIWILIPPGRLG